MAPINKTLITLSVLLAFAAGVIAITPQPPPAFVTLLWVPGPYSDTNKPDSFVIYTNGNLTVPLTNWGVYTNIPAFHFDSTGTNLVITSQLVIPTGAGARYFVITASNLMGQSDFSNAALQPASPPQVGSISLSRGP